MAVDMFLKIDTVESESLDHKHEKSIDVLAFGWGASSSSSFDSGGGGGAGKVSVNKLSITKYTDKASPTLFLACAKGTHFKDALLTIRKQGDKPLEYLKYKLQDVMVTSIHMGGSNGGERLTESMELAYAKIEVTYTPQKKDGSGEGPILVSWDIAKNSKD